MFERAGAFWQGLFLVPQWLAWTKPVARLTRTTTSFFSCSGGARCFAKANLKWTQKRHEFGENILKHKRNATINDINYYPRELTWFVTTSDGIALEWHWQNGAKKSKKKKVAYIWQFYFWMLRDHDSACDLRINCRPLHVPGLLLNSRNFCPP